MIGNAFEIDAGETWLNGAYYSPVPRVARLAAEAAWMLKASPQRLTPSHLFDGLDGVRERLGRLLGLDAAAIGLTGSTGFGTMQLAQGLDWRDGDRLLLGPDEFPSNVYPWRALAARGVRIEAIGERGRALTVEALGRALEAPGRVRALSIGAVHYTSGDVHPLAAFADVLHARGALLFVDASQAAGAIALDWTRSGADAIAFSGYKWLLGPYGTGALWVEPSLRARLANVNGNWLANRGSHDFARLMDEYPDAFDDHGRRFDVGEAAAFLHVGAWTASLDLLLAHGVAAIEAHHRALQDRMVDASRDLPLRAVTQLDDAHRGPMLMFAPLAGHDEVALVRALAERHVHVSARGGRVRVSPGVWCDAADADRFAATLTDALSARPTPASRA